MRQRTSTRRWLVLAMMGGVLLQFSGCLVASAPVFISAIESAIFSAVFGATAPP